jgi:hypothetical protein
MKQVPVFYLRKVWYILLRYTPTQINKSPEWKSEINDIRPGLRIDPLEKIAAEEIKFSAEEMAFNERLNIKFNNAYTIRTGAIGSICIVLPKLWLALGGVDEKYGKDIKSYHKLAFRGKTATNRTLLQEKLNGPLSNIKKPLTNKKTVSSDIAICLCLMAKFACQSIPEEVAEIDRIIEVFNKIPDQSEKIKPAENELAAIESHDRFWRQSNSNIVPNIFHESHWISYERTDANSNDKATWGIAKSYIYVGKKITEDTHQ